MQMRDRTSGPSFVERSPLACDHAQVKSSRRHRPLTFQIVAHVAYWGEVIPPRSLVRLESDWGGDQGRIFRIGYYSRLDGLNCVWLVNEAAGYEQATDQNSIKEDFTVLFRTSEIDHYGLKREILQPATTDELLQGTSTR